MGNRVLQKGFGAGEITSSLFSRSDLEQYKMGATKIKNFVVLPQGAMRTRAGFRYVGTALNSTKPVKLIPFRYSSEQTFILEFGDHTLRVINDGGYVLDKDNNIFQTESPFKAEDLKNVDYSQNADVLTLTNPDYKPYELRRYANTDWRFVQVQMSPVLSAPTGLSYQANYPSFMTSAEQETKEKVTAKYVVTCVDSNNVESVASNVLTAKGNYYITGASIRVKWQPVENADYYRVYREVAGIYGFVGETEDYYIDDVGNNPDTTSTPPKYSNIFEKSVAGVINNIKITNGGSGYLYGENGTKTYLPRSIVIEQVEPIVITGTGELKKPKYLLQIINSQTGSITLEKEIAVNSEKTESNGTTTVKYKLNSPTTIDLTGKVLEVDNCLLRINVQFNGSNGTDSKDLDSLGDLKNNNTFINLCSVGVTIGDLLALWSTPNITCEIPILFEDNKGSGAKANAVCVNGVCSSVDLVSGGTNYSDNVKASLSSTVGSGVQFTITSSEGNEPDYPSSVTQYDQRRVFAGSYQNPLKVWFTTAGQQDLMTYHQPILDDDRIIIVAVNSDADRIKHLVALDSLLLLTGSSELRVFTQNSDALTPRSVAVRAQSFVGANNVQPVIVNNSIVYCAQRGGHVRVLGYDYQQSGYSSMDISVRAPHLFDNKDIKSLSVAKAPVQVIWCVSSDGTLLGCTYLPEQSQVAWHRHKTKNGKFEDVCVISEGSEDHIYVVVDRNGIKTIERSDNFTADKLPEFYRYLDSYLDAIFTTNVNTVNGLNHLENQEVAVFVDGKQQSNKIVKNGKITLDESGKVVAVGLPIECEFISVPLISNYEAELQGRTKNISSVDLRVQYAGQLEAKNYPKGQFYKCKMIDRFENTDESYLVNVQVDGAWSEQSQFSVRHCDCFPVEIQSIILTMSYEDGK